MLSTWHGPNNVFALALTPAKEHVAGCIARWPMGLAIVRMTDVLVLPVPFTLRSSPPRYRTLPHTVRGAWFTTNGRASRACCTTGVARCGSCRCVQVHVPVARLFRMVLCVCGRHNPASPIIIGVHSCKPQHAYLLQVWGF